MIGDILKGFTGHIKSPTKISVTANECKSPLLRYYIFESIAATISAKIRSSSPEPLI